MAKHNRKANPVVTPVTIQNPTEETIMSTQNVMNATEELSRRIEAKKIAMKNKDYKLSELQKLNKAKDLEIKALRELCKDDTKDLTDSYEIKGIEHLYDGYILEVEAKYAPTIKALKIDLEQAGEAFGIVAGEKVGATIAPVTKTVGGFFGTLAKRAGLPSLGK